MLQGPHLNFARYFFCSLLYFINILPPFLPLPHGHRTSHMFCCSPLPLPPPLQKIQRYLFILLSQKRETKKNGKRTASTKGGAEIKEHLSSCEDDGLFCFSSVVLLLLLLVLSPNYSSADDSAPFEMHSGKEVGVSKKDKKISEGEKKRKFFDH